MKRKIAFVMAALVSVGSCQIALAQTTPLETPPAETPPTQTQPVQGAPAEQSAAQPAAQTAPVQSNVIYLGREAAYADLTRIDRAILAECQLPQQQAMFIENVARKAGFEIVRDELAAKAGKGRILQVEIVDALSAGNAFTGHRKMILIKGRLFVDGKETGSFQGRRSSMGGVFAGFKGSCSVLERCLEALAQDITRWLKSPSENARIGE